MAIDMEREIADLLRRQVIAQERIADAAQSEASRVRPEPKSFARKVEDGLRRFYLMSRWSP